MTSPRLPAFRHGPRLLTLVRHAESLGNLADAEARSQGADRLDLDVRDADVELSDNGKAQADALGRWFSRMADAERPALVITSPYRRAADTATRTVGNSGVEVITDERLRERDLGLFDGFTGRGIRAKYAEESERRKKLGKFYYQPPSGESWADVVLRVRSFLTDLNTGYADRDIWLFTHQAVIMGFRYVLEGLSERDLLDIDREVDIANVSLTTYRHSDGALVLVDFADSTIVERAEAEVTHEPTPTDGTADA
jgi:broad specificity phosphatase PhoE